jgi:hypothetical protein
MESCDNLSIPTWREADDDPHERSVMIFALFQQQRALSVA